MLNCYGCHGARGTGNGVASNLSGKEAHDVLEKMQKGEGGGMPTYPAAYATAANAAYLAA